MPSFALITEGITDQAVISAIINSYYRGHNAEIALNFLQPLRDSTDEAREGSFGGWERVLEHCAAREQIIQALTFNDYIVIQIDTDCGEHQNFGVALTEGGLDRQVCSIICDVKNILLIKWDEIFLLNMLTDLYLQLRFIPQSAGYCRCIKT
jgi:hypothetical protein